MSVDRLSRRRALSGLLSVSLVAGGGCLASDKRLAVGVGPAGSRSHQAGQALSVAVDRHSNRFSLTVKSIDSQSERLYALDNGEIAAAGVDNTTLHRASEETDVFDLDPLETLPYQGFAYGRRDHYWLAVDRAGESTPLSTAEFGDEWMVYPGQPSDPSRLVTEQLLRDTELWTTDQIDNRPTQAMPEATASGQVDCLVAVQHSDQLAPWCRQLDEEIGDRLVGLTVGEAFEASIERAPNVVGREIEPAGWERADLRGQSGWGVPLQWLWSPTTDPNIVTELTRIATEHTDTRRSVDPLIGDEPPAPTAAVMPDLPVHEGAATVFRELDAWEGDWTVGDAVE